MHKLVFKGNCTRTLYKFISGGILRVVCSFCFHKNLLLVIQNRNETEEQVTIEGFADSVVWDVYLEANAESLGLKVWYCSLTQVSFSSVCDIANQLIAFI